MKTLIIIGAGISGLSAGIYALQRGYRVTLLERGSTVGGVSTSWSRKGYYFEGGLHWLVGAGPAIAHLHRQWHEVGALNENVNVEFREVLFEMIESDGSRIPFLRDKDRLCEDLMKRYPECARRIRRLHRDYVLFENFFATPTTPWQKWIRALQFPCFAARAARLLTQSSTDYANRFKNPQLARLMGSVLNPGQNAVSLLYTLAGYSMHASGYPEGGSVPIAKRMLARFEELGGKVLYHSEAERVCVENGRATGVMVHGQKMESDDVIVATDTRKAIDNLFEKPINTWWARRMRRHLNSEKCMFVCLGVKADLSRYPESMRVSLAIPLPGRSANEMVKVSNYVRHAGYAPEGGSSVSVLINEGDYDFWLQAKSEGRYKEEKERVTQAVIDGLKLYIPEIEGNVEVTDLATPLTYERYCDTHQGSWMTQWGTWSLPQLIPAKIKSIDHLYFAGHRTLLSGGLPIAMTTGRRAAMSLK